MAPTAPGVPDWRAVAADYLARGWPVVPVRGKAVIVRWKPYQDAFPEPGDVAAWPWHRATGLALVIGPAFWAAQPFCWVMEVEARHRAEAEPWLDEEAPHWRTAGLVCESGGGGLHVYCEAAAAVRSSQYPWGEVRGAGNICVLPPSGHPSGGIYRWLAEVEPILLDPAAVPGVTVRQRVERDDQRDRDDDDRPDARRIFSGCGYLRHVRDDAATLDEPSWHAGLSVLALCRDGDRIGHEVSAPYPDYTHDETQAKLDRARTEDKPHKCETIRRDRGGEPWCAICPSWGRITSPIALGYATPRLVVGESRTGTANANGATEPPSDDGPRLVIVRRSDVQATPIAWVWENRIARGKVHILGGHPGDGKSTLTAWLAAVLSTAGEFPDGGTAPLGGTLFLLGEDALDDTVRPRLDLHGADVTKIDAIQAVSEDGKRRVFDLRKHLDMARAHLLTGRYLLFVIDPLTAFMPQTDRNSEGDVRDVLTLLTDLAEQTNVAVLAIMHVGKPSGTTRRPLQQLLGATAFGAAARLVMMVAEAPAATDQDGQDDGPPRRVLGVVKSNIAPKPPALEWSRDVDGPVIWHGVSEHDIEILLTGGKPVPIETAKAFLIEALKGGSKTSAGLYQAAKADGISRATLRRAKDALGVVDFKQPGTNAGPWLWRLPVGEPPDRLEDAHSPIDTEVSNFQSDHSLCAIIAGEEGAANLIPAGDGKMLTQTNVSIFQGEDETLPKHNGMAGRCSHVPIQEREHLPPVPTCISCRAPLSDGRRYVCAGCEVA